MFDNLYLPKELPVLYLFSNLLHKLFVELPCNFYLFYILVVNMFIWFKNEKVLKSFLSSLSPSHQFSLPYLLLLLVYFGVFQIFNPYQASIMYFCVIFTQMVTSYNTLTYTTLKMLLLKKIDHIHYISFRYKS